jgi:hypothetical protein
VTPQFSAFFSKTRDYNIVSTVSSHGLLRILETNRLDVSDEDRDRSRRVLSEMILCLLLDNFQCYLSDLTLALFQHKPEVLSGGSTKNDIIFGQPDLDTLKKRIIDKHVLDLGYKSILDINAYFTQNFKFPLFTTGMRELRISRLIQIRNIIIHNRAHVNALFVSKAGSKADKVGKPVNLPDVRSVDRYLINAAQDIDDRAISKFGVPHFSVKSNEA